MLTVSVLLLCMSALASGSEVALFSLTPRQKSEMEESGDSRDEAILSLLKNVDELLATILVANNLVNICIVILTSNIIDALFMFNSAPLEFVVKSVLVTFLLLLFGEILPKVLSQSNPHSFARYVVYPIKVFRWICYPLSYVLVRTGGRLSRMATRPEDISMEQLADAVDLAKGASREEHKMLSGIINFVNTEVEEIMRPRIDITALDIKASFEQVKKTIIESGFISEKYLSEKDKYGAFLDGTHRMLFIMDKEAAARGESRPRLLLARDSFANSMVPFLARHFDICMVNLSGGMTNLSQLCEEYGCRRVLIVCNRENLIASDCFTLIQ